MTTMDIVIRAARNAAIRSVVGATVPPFVTSTMWR
jgi:hypothetical protein